MLARSLEATQPAGMRLVACLLIASIVWVQSLHVWFEASPESVREPLAAAQRHLWTPGEDAVLAASSAQLRRANPEWELMARMFTALAFANLALREPARRAEYVHAIDRITDRTIAEVEQYGPTHFLLPYGANMRTRSLFVDGEIAIMLAARQLVERTPERDAIASRWTERVVAHFQGSPVLLGLSYPDEVWLFCNTVALAALRMHDVAIGTPDRHADLFRRWVASAKSRVVDENGLLAARTTGAGAVVEGAEGSTLWLAAAMLRIVDDDFATAQYTSARRSLRGSFAGFGWAREWPDGEGTDDVDSEPTIPIVGANAGSSGLAIIAARAFGDDELVNELLASYLLAGFPVDGGAHFAAGNQLADAVLLYALASGPLWERAL